MILLNPGPVTLTNRVKSSLLREDLCHREPEFGKYKSKTPFGLWDRKF